MGIQDAIQQFHFGRLQRALELLDAAEVASGPDENIVYYRRRVLDLMDPPKPSPLCLMWRARPGWEPDWLSEILPSMPEVDWNTPLEHLARRRIAVIDNRITNKKALFYQQAFEVGCRMLLIHLSDSAFEDDYSVYRWCKSIFRTSFSPALTDIDNLQFFALGYKTGFADGSERLPLSARKFIWSFAGDPNKTTRTKMLNAMRRIEGGCEHLTSGFNAPDSLETGAYREMMKNSLFIPCPQGFATLDSFRVYEALEAGCIPIVERRPDFDYFYGLFGQYPFPAVFEWDEAVSLIDHLRRNNLIVHLMRDCARWWEQYKSALKLRIYQALIDL